MPIYAYKCASCGHQQDVLQKISDDPLTLCPACGQATYAKQVTAAGFQLKGSGWYVTDFRDNGSKKSGKADTRAEGPQDASSAGPSDPRPEAKADPKSDARSDSRSDVKSDAKPDARPNAGPDARSAPAPGSPAPAAAPAPAGGGGQSAP
jgi:putative FmdB family regulatory protein